MLNNSVCDVSFVVYTRAVFKTKQTDGEQYEDMRLWHIHHTAQRIGGANSIRSYLIEERMNGIRIYYTHWFHIQAQSIDTKRTHKLEEKKE